jgi:hypothetical protein
MLDASATERDLGWTPLGFHAGLDRLISWAVDRIPAAAPKRAAMAIAAE